MGSLADKYRVKLADKYRADPAPQKHDTSVEDTLSDLFAPTRTALDSASLGLLPRAIAAGDAVAQIADPRGPKASGFVDQYNENLTKEQTAAEKRARANPSASITGGFLPNLIPGAAEALPLKTVLQRIVAAGGLGALSGDLTAKHDDPEARRRAALASGLTSMALQGVGEKAGPGLDLASKTLRRFSGEQAANVSAGGKAGIGDRFASAGIDPAAQAEFGNQLLDKNLVPLGLNPFEPPVAGVLERSRDLQAKSGQRIGEALNEADATGVPFDPLTAQMNVRQAMAPADPFDAANSKKAGKLVEQIGELGLYPDGETFGGANRMKAKAWKAAQFREDAPLEAQRYRQANGAFRDEIADQVAAAAGKPVAERLGAANADYGLGAKAEELAAPAVSRGGQAQKYAVPAAVLAAAGNPGEAAGILGGSILKSRGPALAAHGGRAASDTAAYLGARANIPLGAAGAGGALSRYFGPAIEGADDPATLEKLRGFLESGAAKASPPNPRDAQASPTPGPSDTRPVASPTAGAQRQPTVDVQLGEPIGLRRVPQPSVEVQALDPTQLIRSNPSTPEQIAADEEARKKERMMRLARFFAGTDPDLDQLSPQR